jgi:NAD(P)-dependent dehydrogenase (short-subunit alcohol dehydrogenase family)
MINPMELTGKQILVAGAASQIGQSIIHQLLSLGAKVIMVDNSEEKLLEISDKYKSKNLAFFTFDMYSNLEIEPQFNHIVNEYGTFNGFVYAAGIGGVRPLKLSKLGFINEMMNANLYSFIEMVRCITRKNSFEKGGSVVAISSVSSTRGLKSKTVYSATNAALDASIRGMATELSTKKIRINSILKGWVTSDMNLDFIANNMRLNKNADFQKQILGAIEPVEIANTVSFLLSDATKTITGTSLLLDGGYSL